jgi:alpha-beta hydrolase superfamily lysophospholipase
LNDALRKIHEVHAAKAAAASSRDKKNKKKKKGKRASAKLKVAVVGHSLGGLVARVAVLLENHPRCLVTNLVMLSTPNVAPAYAMDPSLSTLMDTTNQVCHATPCALPLITGLHTSNNILRSS